MAILKNRHVDPSTSGGPTDPFLGSSSSLDGGYNLSAVGSDVIAKVICTIGVLQAFLSEAKQHG